MTEEIKQDQFIFCVVVARIMIWFSIIFFEGMGMRNSYPVVKNMGMYINGGIGE